MNDLKEIAQWALRAFPHDLGILPLQEPIDAPGLVIAAFNVARGCREVEGGASVDDAAFHLGTGLNGLALELRERDQDEAACETFRAAYTVLASVYERNAQPEHFKKAIGFAYRNLRALGVEAADLQFTPGLAGQPYLPLTRLLSDDGQAVAVRPPAGDGGRGANSLASLVGRLSGRWAAERRDTAACLHDLRRYLETELARSPVMGGPLGSLFDGDCRELGPILPGGLPLQRQSLEVAARELRRFAFQAGDDETERRRRWLSAAAVNYALWKVPGGLPTNAPQVQIDLMGYVGATLMDHRYNDADRDLLLDCAETQVRLARNIAPIVLARFEYLRVWLLAAVGTYLLLTGPNPSSPKDSYYDERVVSADAPDTRGLRRAERETWPEILLREWQSSSQETAGACHALASVCGWELARAQWLVDQIYRESTDQRRDLDRDHWRRRVEELLAGVERVRVATNPWAGESDADSRGGMIKSAASGRFIVPDAVLRSATAEGVGPSEVVAVHGQLFEGRRVPTYLLTNRFGPSAILKIDQKEKVLREVENYQQYARRLHATARPSECIAHEMDLYLGESGQPLRAIRTPYMFPPRDRTLTLRSWLAGSSGDEAVDTIGRFFLDDLRPWLAHVRRDRIDLRYEYQVLRPAPAPGKQSPDNWSEDELQKLESEAVAAAVQVALDRRQPDCDWWDRLEGAASLAGELTREDTWNPLWLAAEIAEVGSGCMRWLVDSFEIGLRDFDTLVCLCHGDLHLDNVLCTSADLGLPHLILIDFESAHEGHVCKDAARLEASVLVQVFDWVELGQVDQVARWFAGSVLGPATFDLETVDAAGPARVATSVVRRVREVVEKCGQGHWGIQPEEYLLALLGSLLPMVRYDTLSVSQRRFALLCATLTASALAARWKHVGRWPRRAAVSL